MTEGEFIPRLHEGDEEMLKVVNENILKDEKIRAVISHDGWLGVLATIETEKQRWIEGLSEPTKLEWKSGVIHGLRLVQDYAKTIEARLNFLYQQKSELIQLGLKNKEK